MQSTLATGIAKAYAADKADEDRIRALGYQGAIFRGDRGQTVDKFVMRPGELLGVVRGLRAFGDSRSFWTDAEERVHSCEAAILDLDTGLRSDRAGAKMFAQANYPLRPSKEYRAMQAASVSARVGDRMPEDEARAIWFGDKTLKEKLALMTGWRKTAIYDTFGRFTKAKKKLVPRRRKAG